MSGNLTPPDGFLARVFQEAPAAARIVVGARATGAVDDALVRVALLTLLVMGDATAEQTAIEMIASGSESAMIVASAVMSARGELNQARTSIVQALLATPYAEVHVTLLSTARWLEVEDRALVLNMLDAAPIEADASVAEAALGALEGKAVPWQSLSSAERRGLLERLEVTPHLPEYELGELLNKEIAVDPFGALEFLLRRVQHRVSTEPGARRYEPLPHLESMGLAFASSDRRLALIEATIDWILADDSWERRYFGKRILKAMAAGYDPLIRAVILDLIRSREVSRLCLARDLLNEAPRDFVIREPEFVVDSLDVAARMDSTLGTHVRAGLHGSAEYGMRSRSIGVDDPQEIALRDAATAIAGHYPAGSTVRDFYLEVAHRASRRLDSEREDDLSLRDPRSWT